MADIDLVIKIPERDYYLACKYPDALIATYSHYIKKGTPLPKGHGRKFEEIVVEYPSADLCTYPEYRGKPYFSIKYEENGEHIIGFGTYKSEVLSRYIREYFISSQPDIEAIRQDIEAYGSLMVEYSLNPILSAEIRDMKISEAEEYIDKCVSDIVDDVLKQAKSEVLKIIDKHMKGE